MAGHYHRASFLIGGTLVCLLSLSKTLGAQETVEETFTQMRRELGQRRYDSAARLGETILDRDPYFARAWLQLLTLHREKGDGTGALPYLERLRQRHPQACYGIAKYWASVKQHEAAKTAATACIEAFPDWLPAHRAWAEAHLATRTQPVPPRPGSAGAHLALGIAAADPAVSAQHLESALRLAPDDDEVDDLLSLLYTRVKNLTGSEAAVRRILARAERRRDGDWLLRAGGRLAQIEIESGRHQSARRRLEQTIPVAVAFASRTSESYQRQLLAGAYVELGLLNEALRELEMLAKWHLDADISSAVHNRLGQVHHYLGRHALALEAYGRAVEFARKAKNPNFEAVFSTNLALTYFDIGDLSRSSETLAVARGLMPRVTVDYYRAIALIDQATLEAALGRSQQALAICQESIDLAAKGKNEVDEARARILRAEVLLRRKLPGTEADLNRAEALLQDRPLPRELTRIALHRGLLSLQRNQFADAEKQYRAAQQTTQLPLLAEAHTGLSDVFWKTGRLTAAYDERQKAIDVNEQIRGGLDNPIQSAGFLARRLDVYRQSAQIALAQQDAERAFANVERGRARSLLDLLSDQSPFTKPGEEEYNLNAALTSAQDEYRLTKGDKAALARVQQARRALRDYYDTRRESMTGLDRPATAKEIAAALATDSAFLHYTAAPNWAALFVLTREGVHHVPLPAARTLENDVRALRGYLSKPPRRIDAVPMRQAAERLHAALLAPVARWLRGKTNLIVAADGPLHAIPFDALIAPDGRYVLEQYTVQYAPSASAWLALRRPATVEPSRDLIAFADASTSGNTASVRAGSRPWQLEALPHAREEAQAAARAWRSPTVYLGKDASEAALKREDLARYRVLHFAVHGILDDEHPRFSALALTPGDGEDGLLQLHEIRQLRLANGLAILSACETALGEQIGGEGVVGLAHAFLTAGARSVIASLWRVDDQATAQTMSVFHQAHAKGASPVAALRQARLAMLRNPSTAHPFYWAGLVLNGTGGH